MQHTPSRKANSRSVNQEIPLNFQFQNILLYNFLLKMTVFWDVAPCGLVETYQRFIGACSLRNQDVGHLLPH
jgi:hypothetical protein